MKNFLNCLFHTEAVAVKHSASLEINRLLGQLGVLLLALSASAQIGQSPSTDTTNGIPKNDYSMIEQSRHWQKIRRTQAETNVLTRRLEVGTSDYTELGVGLNRIDPSSGKLRPCDDQITIQRDGGAAATNAQHRLSLPGNLYGDSIELTTPDQQFFAFRPVGLLYTDGKKSAL